MVITGDKPDRRAPWARARVTAIAAALALTALLFAAASAQAATVTVTATSPTLNPGDSTAVTASLDAPGATNVQYAWTLSGGGTITPDTDPATATATPDGVGDHVASVDVTYDVAGVPGTASGNATITVQAPPPPPPPPPPVNQPPVASFTAVADGADPRVFHFTSTSTDPDTPADQLQLAWDLNDDGTFSEAGGTKATATFPGPGTFFVSLRVSDGASTITTRQPVTVGDRPPTVALSVSPNPALPGQAVAVTAKAGDPDGDALTYAWDVNGRQFSGATIPAQVFGTPGVYKVKVTVTAGGASASDADAIVVQQAPSSPAIGALPLLQPFPLVRVRGQIFKDGTKFDIVSARAPRSARASARCIGKGCPRRWMRAAAPRRTRWVRFTQLERKLRPGAVLEVVVMKPGTIGKYARFVVRAGRPPARRDRCVRGTSLKVVRCPTH